MDILATQLRCKQTLILYFVNTSNKAGKHLVEVRTTKYYFKCYLETIMFAEEYEIFKPKIATTKPAKPGVPNILYYRPQLQNAWSQCIFYH